MFICGFYWQRKRPSGLWIVVIVTDFPFNPYRSFRCIEDLRRWVGEGLGQIQLKRDPAAAGSPFFPSGSMLNARQAFIDGAEDVADDRAKQHQHSNDDNGDEDEDQRIFNQPLAFFSRCEQHSNVTPFLQ